jgi:hypothetical protein
MLKSDIVRGSYDLFTAGRRSTVLLTSFWHTFTFFSVSLALNSEISIYSQTFVVDPRSFNLRPRTLKSDIVRGSYDLFTAGRRSTLLLPFFWQTFTF